MTLFFTLLTYTWFEWKGLVAFVPFWTLFELHYRLRRRASLSCDHCGFDPFLYLTDVKRARTAIESHWKRVFEERGIPLPKGYGGTSVTDSVKTREPEVEGLETQIPRSEGET